jgi:osmotically-inducible protein OsmY
MSPTAPAVSRAAEALKQSAHPALRQLDVQETESAIVLTGRVSSYYLKQLAQEAVMPVRGERQLVNQVTVVRF